jgi:HEAT repeat protein
MNTADGQSALGKFLEHGDWESLVKFLREAFPDVPAYQEAAVALAGALDALNFGETPHSEVLDKDYLAQRASETVAIVNWMADSTKADMQESAIDVMGTLGWEPFLVRLESLLCHGEQWQRIAALRSLARLRQPVAQDLLHRAAQDSDPVIRAEALRVLVDGSAL